MKGTQHFKSAHVIFVNEGDITLQISDLCKWRGHNSSNQLLSSFVNKGNATFQISPCYICKWRGHNLLIVVYAKWAIFSHIIARPSYFLIKWWWCLFCTIPFWEKKYKIMPSFMSRWSWVCLWCVTLPNKDLSCKVCM